MSNKKAVIALGNPLRGDDGIGIRLLHALEKRELPPDVSLLDGGTGGVKILHLLKDLDEVLFIDAVSFDGEPGSHVFFTPGQVTSRDAPKSMHDPALLEVLELSEELKEKPHTIVIMGIQPKATEMGQGLSKELKNKLDDLVEVAIKKVQKR